MYRQFRECKYKYYFIINKYQKLFKLLQIYAKTVLENLRIQSTFNMTHYCGSIFNFGVTVTYIFLSVDMEKKEVKKFRVLKI